MPVQRRPITVQEYHELAAIGVLGEDVELLDGWIVYGKFPFAFAEEAVEAARAAGIELTEPIGPATATRASTPAGEPTTRAARRTWEALEAIMLILVERGGAHIATAVSWLAEPDDALGGQSPTSWIAAGRDAEQVALIARRDAARLAQ